MKFLILAIYLILISCGSKPEDLNLAKKVQNDNLTDSYEANLEVAGKNKILLQGFDRLSNSSKERCLDEKSIKIQRLEVNEGVSELKVLQTVSDISRELKLGLGLGGGGGFGFIGGELGFDIEKAWKGSSSKKSIYALMKYSYLKEKITIHTTDIALSKNSIETLKESKRAFRKKCGDVFVEEEQLGASLYVLFEGKYDSQYKAAGSKFETLFEVALAGLIKGKINPRYEEELESFWENVEVDVDCFHIGGESDVCTAAALDNTSIYGEEEEFRRKLAQTKDLLAQDIKERELLGVIKRGLKNYPVAEGESINDKYFDYRRHNENISDWEYLDARIERATSGIPYYESELREYRGDLLKAMEQCTNMDHDKFANCEGPENYFYDDLLNAEDLGQVKVYGTGLFGGMKSMMLNFNRQSSDPDKAAKPDTLYSLADFGFDNTIEVIDVNLKPGWKIHFFDFADATGAEIIFGSNTKTIYFSVTHPYFNKKASSFMLVKVD